MNVTDLLDECVATLQPFAQTVDVGSQRWNGTAYVPVTKPQIGDIYASAWAASLRTAAQFLNLQEKPTESQIALLRNLLFGGMGTFQDFQLDTKRWGAEAHAANVRLEQLRAKLFKSLSHD